jgi:hypothetical protein
MQLWVNTFQNDPGKLDNGPVAAGVDDDDQSDCSAGALGDIQSDDREAAQPHAPGFGDGCDANAIGHLIMKPNQTKLWVTPFRADSFSGSPRLFQPKLLLSEPWRKGLKHQRPDVTLLTTVKWFAFSRLPTNKAKWETSSGAFSNATVTHQRSPKLTLKYGLARR